MKSIGSSRTNSVAFLRLVLAALVIYSHASPLGGFQNEALVLFSCGRWDFGTLAVDGFFFLSGLLIAGSYLKTKSIWRYLWHRFLRIFPGFWVCLLATVCVFAPLASLWERCGLAGYFSPPTGDGPIAYLLNNALLVMNQYSISDLLASVPTQRVFDGSLWTLSSEFFCYLFVALAGVTALLRRARWSIVLLFLAFYVAASTPGTATAAAAAIRGIPVLGFVLPSPEVLVMVEFFLVGCLFCIYEESVRLNAVAFAVALAAIPLAALSPFMNCVEPIALSYVLYWLAYKLPIRNFDKFGDFSYGTYIYAYPVQQLVALVGLNRFGFWPYVGLSVAGTAPLAVLSWFFVERRAMSLKNVTFWRGPRKALAPRD